MRTRDSSVASVTYVQGWVFAMAKTIFARTVVKTVVKTGKNSGVRISFHCVSIS